MLSIDRDNSGITLVNWQILQAREKVVMLIDVAPFECVDGQIITNYSDIGTSVTIGPKCYSD